ncbi:MAG: RdgB/HAM1 family non-canonical purine NTP pyrophosphatase [Ferruginibacter sp.]
MRTLLFATNNANKVSEVRAILGDQFNIQSLQEAGVHIDIPEPHDKLEDNAREKSSTVHTLTGQHCFAEDTGLEVLALQGEPGVRSARYAGEKATDAANIQKLLAAMDGQPDRRARFRTVISLILDNVEYQFEGICHGQIAHSVHGENGFGYDPIFIPEGENRCFAEMTASEKNTMSHRKKATQAFVDFLTSSRG